MINSKNRQHATVHVNFSSPCLFILTCLKREVLVSSFLPPSNSLFRLFNQVSHGNVVIVLYFFSAGGIIKNGREILFQVRIYVQAYLYYHAKDESDE